MIEQPALVVAYYNFMTPEEQIKQLQDKVNILTNVLDDIQKDYSISNAEIVKYKEFSPFTPTKAEPGPQATEADKERATRICELDDDVKIAKECAAHRHAAVEAAVAFERDRVEGWKASFSSKDANLQEAKLTIASLRAQLAAFGAVHINVVPGEHGEGEEAAATPESTKFQMENLANAINHYDAEIQRLRNAALVQTEGKPSSPPSVSVPNTHPQTNLANT